jgi:phytoene dehydrogenase-like protein
MAANSILIIGSGIAGMAAGCYGQMNGFRTRIFEMHSNKPGGLCTSWQRQGYTINGCLHWLVGSGPGSDFHRIWTELGALQSKSIVDYEEFGRIEAADGNCLIMYSDLARLERHLKELSPEDGPLVEEFIAAARVCVHYEPPVTKAPELMSVLDLARMLVSHFPLLRLLRKWNKVSLAEFGRSFRHPLLREAFPLMFLPDSPVTFMLFTFAWLHKKTAGYPVGGSLAFSRAIEERYLALGGKVHYHAKVAKILSQGGRAVGVRLEDGSEHTADYVISAADGHTTIFEMLEGRYVDRTIRGYYERLRPFPPLVHIGLGVNRQFKEQPAAAGLVLELPAPLVVGGVTHRYLSVRIHNFDPTLAPTGKTLLVVILATDYDYWQRLRNDEQAYRAEKEKLADQVVAILDRRFPGLAGQVEMRDVATPTTFLRYTGNWRGSFEGWQVTPETWRLGKVMKKSLPGLANFYMAGHWVEPGGGLPAAAMSGRNVIQIICRQEKRKFTSATPMT